MEALVTQLCLTLCDTMDCRLPTPLSMGFSRQEYWSGCHSLLQGIFPTKRSNPASASQADPLPSKPPGVLHHKHIHTHLKKVHRVWNMLCVSSVLVAQSCLTLCDPMTVARPAPLSMGFSRQEYWSGLPFTSPISSINSAYLWGLL